jgi:hypothetical protein
MFLLRCHESGSGTQRTSRAGLAMSVDWGRPEVTGTWPRLRQSDDGSADCRATNDVRLGIALQSGVMQHLVVLLTRLNGAWNGPRCR